MLFTSVAFFPFLILVFLIYYLPVTGKWQLPWLVAASLFFYALNQLSLVLLLLAIAAVDIVCSHRIVVSQRPRLWAIAGVVSNLLVLAFFKYNHLFASLFSSVNPLHVDIPHFLHGGHILDIGAKYPAI